MFAGDNQNDQINVNVTPWVQKIFSLCVHNVTKYTGTVPYKSICAHVWKTKYLSNIDLYIYMYLLIAQSWSSLRI